MLDLARHIVNQKSGRFEPDKFEDHYETALIDLINSKRAGKPITPKERPRGENVVDLMDALRKSVGGAAAETRAPKKSAKKPRKGGGRPEGDADADRRQEAGEGGRCQEAGGQAAEVGLVFRAGTRGKCRRSNPVSRISATASSGETPAGGSRRAAAKARSRACGSARSCIQPCSSHSRTAPASCSTEIAHPRSVRISEMLGRSAHLRNRRGEQNAGSGSDQLFTGRH